MQNSTIKLDVVDAGRSVLDAIAVPSTLTTLRLSIIAFPAQVLVFHLVGQEATRFAFRNVLQAFSSHPNVSVFPFDFVSIAL